MILLICTQYNIARGSKNQLNLGLINFSQFFKQCQIEICDLIFTVVHVMICLHVEYYSPLKNAKLD